MLLARLLGLLEHLSDDGMMDSLEAALDMAQQAPGMASMIVDMVDEQAQHLQDEEIDIEAGLTHGLRAALRLGALIGPRELDTLHTLLTYEALDPEAIAVVSEAASALHAAHMESPQKIGLCSLTRYASNQRMAPSKSGSGPCAESATPPPPFPPRAPLSQTSPPPTG